jgi:hypothetical protein
MKRIYNCREALSSRDGMERLETHQFCKGEMMRYVTVTVVLLVSLVFLVCCDSSDSLSGEFVCTEHYTESMVGKISLDFQKDGTVHMKPLNSEGDYAVEGNKVTVHLEQFDLTFTRDGDKLISSDKTVVYQKQ